MSAISAISQAIELAQAPRLATHMRRRPLPRGVLALIRLASGCPETIAATAASTSRKPDFVVAAAELYLRQVMCFPGADPYRVLGVEAGAPRAQMRQHMRALVLWLHPDRNPRGWDAILMQRVVEAWRTVGKAESRGPAHARVLSPVVPRHGRARKAATYRPTWIAQPLPKTRRAGAPRQPFSMTLRVAVVILTIVVPEHAFMGPPSLADGRAEPAAVRAMAEPSMSASHRRSDLK